MKSVLFKFIIARAGRLLMACAFLLLSIDPSPVHAQAFQYLPESGAAIALSPSFTPAYLSGLVVDRADPFKFDFIVNRGDEVLSSEQKQAEYTKLIKYFLAALAVPDADQWVNLSPYEKDRIVPDNFGKTEMGRDLLAQDYILKQISSSLTDPNSDLGKKFWDKVYEAAHEKFGNTNISTDTFNKVWIIPDKAVLYEKGDAVYVVEHHLKVMLEADYMAMRGETENIPTQHKEASPELVQDIMRAILIPVLEKEVNEGRSFAQLRQVYNSMLLAAWVKRSLKGSLLTKVYSDQSRVKGIDQDPGNNQQIYERYVAAFKAGVFNLIREDVDKYTHEVIPRKYFSGGIVGVASEFDNGQVTVTHALPFEVAGDAVRSDLVRTVLQEAFLDRAMVTGSNREYRYPAGQADVIVSNPNKNYVRTSQGSVSLGISMLHRSLVPDKADFPAIIVAPPSGNWVGEDGSNLMQAYFAIAANYYFHGRKTVVVVRNELEKERITRYLDLGNPYFLPNEGGYSQGFIDQMRREAIVLADRADVGGRLKIISPARILESDSPATTMVDFKVLVNGETMVGDVRIVDQRNGTVLVVDGEERSVLDGDSLSGMDSEIKGLEPLRVIPQLGVTFLGTSSGMDANGLASNQVVWAGQKGYLVDAGPAVVGALTALGIDPKDMEYVVLTHMHEDHVAGMLGYFAWLKKNGRPIKMLAEPGIYKLFERQSEIVLGASLESVYAVEVIPVKFGETVVLGTGDEAVRIKAIAAFHGTPTMQFRISYKGRTISHSSDTALAPLRIDALAQPGLPGIPENIKTDLRQFTDYRDGQSIFSPERAKEIKSGLFISDESGRRPELVIYEGGYGKPGALEDMTNHTSPFDLGNLSEDDQRIMVVNHTAQLPQGVSPLIRQALAFSTIDLLVPQGSDPAGVVVNPGGIDMNAAGMDMQIRRDGGGIPLPAALQDLDNIHIEGFVPVILDIKPATSLPALLN